MRAVLTRGRFGPRAAIVSTALLALLLAPRAAFAQRALTLEEALAIAREESPSLAIAQARLTQAEADLTLAGSALLPKVAASASYNRLGADRLGPTGVTPDGRSAAYGSELFVGLRARQVLFDGLRGLASRRSASHGVEAELAGIETARAELDYAVVQSFVRLVGAQQQVEVAQQAHGRQQAFESLTDARVRGGRGTRLDVLRATAQRLDAERVLAAAQGTRAVTEAQLRRLLGTPDATPLRAAGRLPESLPPPPDEEAVVAAALASNPDYGRVRLQVRQAQATASAAAAGWFPELSLQGAAGYRARDVGGEAPEWNAGVFLDWPLFDGGATVGQVRRARARVAELEQAPRALALQLRADVREALAAWEVAVSTVRASTASAAASHEADGAATALFEQGRATALDVLTGHADTTRAEAARIQALAELSLARARLDRLIGRSGAARLLGDG